MCLRSLLEKNKEGIFVITKISDKKINLKIFLPPVIALCAFVISGAIWPKKIGGLMTSMLYGMADHFGWYLNLLSLLLLILAVCIVISRYGDVRIGGRDAKPEFTTFQWISMTICGGIGTGLLFWAMGEPIFHYAVPPRGRRRGALQPRQRHLRSLTGHVELVLRPVCHLHRACHHLGSVGLQQENVPVL